MTDDGDSLDGAAGGSIRLPDTMKASIKEFFENRDPEAFEAFLTGIFELSVEQSHLGPLPDPQTLASYENVLPGLAERIVRLAERPHEELAQEQSHRHAMERQIVGHTRTYRTTGLWMGFLIACASLAAGLYCAVNGFAVGAVAFLSLPLVGIVSVLVSGRPWSQSSKKGDSDGETAE